MVETIIYIIIWCFAVYGFFSLIQDINRNSTYKKIEENVKIVMFVKNVENGIENYVREISCGRNFYNNLVVIDLESKDETLKILKQLENECLNIKILNKEEGKKYIDKVI